MKPAFLFFIITLAALTAHARAACSADLRTHVALGMNFLKEAQAYDARNEDTLAAAEWENLGHQVQLIGGADSPDVMSCDDPVLNRQFYLLASWDEFKQILASTHQNPQVPAADARLFRQLVSILNHFGGATYYRADYLSLKSFVRQVDGLASIPYCSPEQPDKACEAQARQCPVIQRAAAFAHAVNPIMPDAVKQDFASLNDSTGDDYQTTVTVNLDASGRVIDATVSQSANAANLGGQLGAALALMDTATLQAAKTSTYHPVVADCKPVAGTFVFQAVHHVLFGGEVLTQVAP